MNQIMISHEHAYLAGSHSQHAGRLFHRNLNFAKLHRWFGKILGKDGNLREPTGMRVEAHNSSPIRGVQIIPISKIAGSMSRSQDFDRSFRPLMVQSKDRWVRIDNAFHGGIQLPPVKLYYRDGSYFVVDGHHRISVARAHGQEYIDAEVVPLP
jgi:hypothetical protein